MSKNFKKLPLAVLALSAFTLAGCGSSDDAAVVEVETPLWCKAPQTINEAGDACELVITACNYPEVANELGLCEMDKNEWIDGSNGITMPIPEYIAGTNEVVYYFNTSNGDVDGWGLHAWNNDDCASYADFAVDGGTSWDVPLVPTGVDANFGAYWVMNINDAPDCASFIPHNLDLSEQTTDLTVQLSSTATNPTGNFYVLGKDAESSDIFGYPRTFESLVIPGGASLSCDLPQILNEANDKCIVMPLVLRGAFNDGANDGDYAFSFANNAYTMVVSLAASADAYDLTVTDGALESAMTYGAATDEQTIVLGEEKTLTATDALPAQLTLDADANVQLTIDFSDAANPKLTVIEVVYNQIMFVKGDMNGWGNELPMSFDGDNLYSAAFTLEAKSYGFKVADAAWTEATNFGAAEGDEEITLDVAKTLVFGNDIAKNISVTAASEGTVKFTLDATTKEAPVLTVSQYAHFNGLTMMLKGSMNGWGGGEGFEFVGNASGIFTLDVGLEAGSHEFKIADADWSAGAIVGGLSSDAIVLGQVAAAGGNNIKIELDEAATYSFTLDNSVPTAATLTIIKKA